jgi:uncharacterized protein (DUF952 family)
MTGRKACVFKILGEAEWTLFQAEGRYIGSAADRNDGFIHFSTAAQVQATLAKHYAGQSALLLLAVAPEDLPEPLKWEEARGGQLFPHLYTALPLGAVKAAAPIELGSNGLHICPAEVLAWA